MSTTPRPWKAHKPRLVESSIYKANIHHEKAESYMMPAAAYGASLESAEANADLIVRAVNTFDEAKAALQAIILMDTKRVGITVNPHILYCEAVAKAKAVLARMIN